MMYVECDIFHFHGMYLNRIYRNKMNELMNIISGNAQDVSTVACVCRINETGWTWVHFQTTPPISTFSVAVAVLDLESTSATTIGG